MGWPREETLSSSRPITSADTRHTHSQFTLASYSSRKLEKRQDEHRRWEGRAPTDTSYPFIHSPTAREEGRLGHILTWRIAWSRVICKHRSKFAIATHNTVESSYGWEQTLSSSRPITSAHASTRHTHSHSHHIHIAWFTCIIRIYAVCHGRTLQVAVSSMRTVASQGG